MAIVLLTHTPDALAVYYGDEAVAGIAALAEVRFHHGSEPLSTADLIEVAQGCELIVSDRATAGEAELFQQISTLTAFVRCAVDIRTIDVAAASAAGVLVTHASPGFVPAVAELVIGMMVDLGRGVSAAMMAYRTGRQAAVRMGTQLAGSTLGIIGYGSIGSYLGQLGKALGLRVLVNDPYATVTDSEIQQLGLAQLLEQSDFVVCLAVANDETENLIGAEALARMKPSAYFINVSRGNLVDEAALRHALEQGTIAGAAMDVGRAPDQMPTPQLAALPNVVATPHIGGLTPAAIRHQALETVRQADAILRGEIPPGAINPEHAIRLKKYK